MKIFLVLALVVLASVDARHLLKKRLYSGFPASYTDSEASQLGSSAQSASFSGFQSASYPQLSLPTSAGQSVSFTSGYSTPGPNGVSIQSYDGFSNSVPSGSLSGLQVSSTPGPGLDFSNLQVSTGASNLDLSGFQVSSQSSDVDLSNYQVSSQSPNIDLSGFQVSTPSSNPSVNFLQYSQPSNSYQFVSQLNQPGVNLQSLGLSSGSRDQLGNDALINSGNFGPQGSINRESSGGQVSSGSYAIATDAEGSEGASVGNQQSEVSKHLYFFAAPEEKEEEIQAKIDLPPVPPKRTYKIIFIKAPTYRNQAAINIPALPQNEEKTLVYVLVKKPDGQAKIRYQNAAPAKPTKPEVFFIKYKTQQEAEAAVAEIQSKHGVTGQVIAKLPAGVQSASIQSEGQVIANLAAAAQSVSSTPTSVNYEESDSAGGQSAVSYDSVSANNFVSSTPSAAYVEHQDSESLQEEQGDPNISQEQENVHAQIGGAQENVQTAFGHGDVNPSPTPVSIAQSSVDSRYLSGSGFVSTPASTGTSESSTVFNLIPEEDSDQSSAGDSPSSSSVEGQPDNGETDAYESEGSENIHASLKAVAQNVGFSQYGPPK